MQAYESQDLAIQINSQTVSCLVSYQLSENVELVPKVIGDQKWAKFEANLQGFEISLSGIDDGGHAFLRNFKRNFTKVSWSISGINISFTGEGHITSLQRSSPPSGNLSFSATLTGYGAIV